MNRQREERFLFISDLLVVVLRTCAYTFIQLYIGSVMSQSQDSRTIYIDRPAKPQAIGFFE
jgi:hypothetical protein